MYPTTLVIFAAVSAISAHSSSYQRPSLGGGGHSFDHIVSLKNSLTSAPLPVRLDPLVTLSVTHPYTTAPPSGLVPVTVAWSSPTWTSLDVIALACAGEKDLGDYYNLSFPSGSFQTNLVHGLGCTFEFRYVAGGLLGGGGRVVSLASPPPLGDDRDPVGTRISFGDGAGDILFTFSSLTNGSAYVNVSTTPGGPYTQQFLAAPPVSYRAEDLCHAPANTSSILSYIFPGYFHTATLTLTPATRYWAVYGHTSAGASVAPEVSFLTRSPPSPDTPTRFAIFADSALYPVFPGTVATVDNINALDGEGATPIDFVAVAGDLAYAEGSTALWALWAAFMFPIASRIPFLVTVGNHETNVNECYSAGYPALGAQALWQGPTPSNTFGDDCGGEGGIATYLRYSAPSNGQGIHWYSFQAGSVQFIHMSSEHDFTPGSSQHTWLTAELGGVNRTSTPWLVVALHRPPYNSMNDSDWSIGVGMRVALEGLWVEAGVDLVFAGHYHSHLRTHPLRNSTVDPSGKSPTYITVGTGGATYHNEPIRSDSLAWTASWDAEWGFGLVEAFNASALRYTFRSNVLGGAIKDEVWLSK